MKCIATLVLASLLAACGGAGPTPTPIATSTSVPTATPTHAPPPVLEPADFTGELLDSYYGAAVRGCIVTYRFYIQNPEVGPNLDFADDDALLPYCEGFSYLMKQNEIHKTEPLERTKTLRSSYLGDNPEILAFRLGHLSGCEFLQMRFMDNGLIDRNPSRSATLCLMLLDEDIPLSAPYQN